MATAANLLDLQLQRWINPSFEVAVPVDDMGLRILGLRMLEASGFCTKKKSVMQNYVQVPRFCISRITRRKVTSFVAIALVPSTSSKKKRASSSHDFCSMNTMMLYNLFWLIYATCLQRWWDMSSDNAEWPSELKLQKNAGGSLPPSRY